MTPHPQLFPLLMARYGLTQQPFSGEFAEQLIIETDSLSSSLETIAHHLQFSNLVICIEGETSSGKSTLATALSQSTQPNIALLSTTAHTTDSISDVKNRLMASVDEPHSSDNFSDYICYLHSCSQTPVCIIDDAHVLSDITLEALTQMQNLANPSYESIKLVFFTLPEFTTTLNTRCNLGEELIYRLEIPIPSVDEVGMLIEHKIRAAGFHGISVFTERELEELVYDGNGNIGQILDSACKKLNDTNIQRTKPPEKHFGMRPSTILLIAIGVLITILMYYEPAPPAIDNLHVADATPLFVYTPEAESPAEENNTEESAPVKTREEIEQEPEQLVREPLSPEAPAQVSAVNIPDEALRNEKDVVTHHLESTPAPALSKQTPVIEEKQPPNETIAASKKPIVATIVTIRRPTTTIPGLHNADWLLLQSPDAWTLQILGAQHPEALSKIAGLLESTHNLAWFQTRHNNSDWYVLVYGVYSDRDTARNQRSILPFEIRKISPWPRSMASIHKAIAIQ